MKVLDIWEDLTPLQRHYLLIKWTNQNGSLNSVQLMYSDMGKLLNKWAWTKRFTLNLNGEEIDSRDVYTSLKKKVFENEANKVGTAYEQALTASAPVEQEA